MAVAYAMVLLLPERSTRLWPPSLAGEDAFRWLMVVGTAVVVGLLVRRLTESLRESERRFGQCIQDAAVGMARSAPTGAGFT